MNLIYCIGPAGAGKSTLIGELVGYIQNFNQDVNLLTINLDPAVRTLPYSPDIDIQDYINIDQVIEKTQLGPNGAMIAAVDQMVNYLDDIKYEISQYNEPDYILVDTPGQMELFAFRNSGPMIANGLGFGQVQRATMFCYDAQMCSRPNGFISTLLLAASVQFRFSNIPQINVLTKKDLISPEKLEEMLGWMEDEYNLEAAVEAKERGMMREITLALSRAFVEFGTIPELHPISSKYHEGIDDLWAAIQRLLNDDNSGYY
jgi:GTPase SAR1 family protein